MAARNFGTLTVDVVAKVGGFEEGMSKADRATQKFSKSVQSQQQDLDRLIGKIDPVVGRLSEIDRMEEKLRQHRKSGLLPADDFDEYLGKLNGMRDALGTSATGFSQAGKSAGEMNAALRTLPAQFTDVFTSLQAGQDPLTVFLQQGGQIKDSFGGAGPALRETARYAMSLVNPLTVAGAAAAALYLAYEQGADEEREFQSALTLTGNVAGTTSSQLGEIADRLSEVSGTRGAAAAALTEVAKSGEFTSQQFELVTASALAMQRSTGQAISETISQFKSLADDPVDAVVTLNEQYNFLTADIYNQIKALQDAGREQEASQLAMDQFGSTVQQRSAEIVDNVGYIEQAWHGVTSAIRGAWDMAKDIGRDDGINEQIAKLQAQISSPGSTSSTLGFSGFFRDNSQLEANKQLLAQLIQQRDMEAEIAAAHGQQQQQQKDAIEAMQRVDSITQQTLTNEQKRNQEVAEYKRLLEDIRSVNPDDERLKQENVDKVLANINAKYKDPATKKAVQFRDDAATSTLLQLQQQATALEAQLQSTTKLSTQEQAIVKFNQQIADLQGKDQLTAAQQSILLHEQEIRNQLEINAALAQQVQRNKELQQIEAMRAQQQQQLVLQAQSNALTVQGVGMGDQELQRSQELLAIQQQYLQQAQQLQLQYNTGDITQQQYEEQLEILRNYTYEAVVMQEDMYEQMDAAQSDWANGASAAWANFETDAANTASSMESAFSSALDSTSDALADFVTTGKLSFSDLANSIIKDLARIGVQKAIVGMAGSLFGGSSGGESGGSVEGLFASGGYVSGPGTGTSDSIPARLSNGEFVINAQATAKNRPILEAINSGRGFADGGYVSADNGGSNSYTITSGNSPSNSPIIQQTITVQGDASESTVARLQEAARQGAEQGYRLVLQDFRRNGQALQLARKGIK